MSAVLLEARGLGKSYPVNGHAGRRARALLDILLGRYDRAERSVVLKNIDLTVRRGESLGIVGENGAGKSTLLKVLTGVTRPTTGVVERHGTMAALLELSAGFDQELSGFDNIFMKTALLGMGRRQTRACLDRIIEFADIGEALYQPVKTYSSGMVVRLGFAIVAIQRPELLLTDEVLAVGDASFSSKCIAWLDDYLAGGGTLLMVSHSTYQIKRLCPRSIWIHDHSIAMQGPSDRVVNAYLDWHAEKQSRQNKQGERIIHKHTYQVLKARLLNGAGEEITALRSGEDLRIELELTSPDGRKPVAGFGIVDREGLPVYGVASTEAPGCGTATGNGAWRYGIDLPAPPLLPGGYWIRAHALDPEGIRLCDTLETRLDVHGETLEVGACRIGHQWR